MSTGGNRCKPRDRALLLRIVGWRRVIQDDELDAAGRLQASGLIRLEIRVSGFIWGEATDQGMAMAPPVLTNAQHGQTITRYWNSGGRADDERDREA
jgi:hypothetical protein